MLFQTRTISASTRRWSSRNVFRTAGRTLSIAFAGFAAHFSASVRSTRRHSARTCSRGFSGSGPRAGMNRGGRLTNGRITSRRETARVFHRDVEVFRPWGFDGDFVAGDWMRDSKLLGMERRRRDQWPFFLPFLEAIFALEL